MVNIAVNIDIETREANEIWIGCRGRIDNANAKEQMKCYKGKDEVHKNQELWRGKNLGMA